MMNASFNNRTPQVGFAAKTKFANIEQGALTELKRILEESGNPVVKESKERFSTITELETGRPITKQDISNAAFKSEQCIRIIDRQA